MRVRVLSSGSKGNTTYIECEGKRILIDIGNSCKYVKMKLEELKVKGEDIDAILITHTHIDHIKGLKVFLKRYNSDVYITRDALEEIDYVGNYHIIDSDKFMIGNVVVEVIKTSHDAKGSVGYVINGDGKSVVYITDTGYINSKYFNMLSNRDMYVMESNHDVEMLNNGRYPFSLRQRILGDKGHLSNYDSSKYISKFVGNRTKCVVLAHLSMENNTKEIAYDTLMERFDCDNISLDKVIIAMQDEETELIEL